MAQTTILSSISNTDSIITSNITADNNCGTLSLILTQIWTKQMLFELPNINFTILYNGTIYMDFNVNMETINRRTNKDTGSDLNVEPYSIAIYNIPSSFELLVTPMFDRNAVDAHNELIDNGIEDGALWTSSDTFPIKILFDDSNVSSSGTSGGGGGSTPTASDVSYDGSSSGISATNVKGAIDEVQGNVNTVNTKIDNLPKPMIFKGSLGNGGTITTLPTASNDNKGFTYKVITDGTYAGQTAKIGDTFISDGTTWVLIPSGDEPSGTVTNVAITSTDGSATITGSPITSSGTIDISVVTDSTLNANSTKPVQNALLSRLFTSLSQAEYDAITNKDLPLYFIYD